MSSVRITTDGEQLNSLIGVDSMKLGKFIVLQHRVCKMRITVPKDAVQTHLSNGKPVLYTISFSPAEWRIMEEDE